jgi:hypothetical protein
MRPTIIEASMVRDMPPATAEMMNINGIEGLNQMAWPLRKLLVTNLAAGLNAWIAAELPVVK